MEIGAIRWADKGERSVVLSPSVIYNNGKIQRTELPPANIVTDLLYETFSEDGRHVYYGTYRCIKRIPVDWDILTSFGKEVSTRLHTRMQNPRPNDIDSFFDRVVVWRDFVPPVIVSPM